MPVLADVNDSSDGLRCSGPNTRRHTSNSCSWSWRAAASSPCASSTTARLPIEASVSGCSGPQYPVAGGDRLLEQGASGGVLATVVKVVGQGMLQGRSRGRIGVQPLRMVKRGQRMRAVPSRPGVVSAASRPPRRLPGRTALSSYQAAATAQRGGLAPPSVRGASRRTSASWRTEMRARSKIPLFIYIARRCRVRHATAADRDIK